MPVSFGSGSSATVYARNPRLILWGPGSNNMTQGPGFGNAARAAANVTSFLRWQVGETIFGAEESWIDIEFAFTASNNPQTYTDIDFKPDGALFEGLFSLLPGLWKFSLMSRSVRTGAENDQVRIYKVVSGDDDELIAEGTTGLQAFAGQGTDEYYVSVVQKTPPVEVEEDDIFYVCLGNHSTLGQQSQYMELEYLGPA